MHGGEQTFAADAGIVDEAIDRAEFFAQHLDEGWDCIDLAEVERFEMKSAFAVPEFADGILELVALAPRHADDVVAGGGEFSRDCKADAAACAGDENVTHRISRACRPASRPAPRQSGSP